MKQKNEDAVRMGVELGASATNALHQLFGTLRARDRAKWFSSELVLWLLHCGADPNESPSDNCLMDHASYHVWTRSDVPMLLRAGANPAFHHLGTMMLGKTNPFRTENPEAFMQHTLAGVRALLEHDLCPAYAIIVCLLEYDDSFPQSIVLLKELLLHSDRMLREDWAEVFRIAQHTSNRTLFRTAIEEYLVLKNPELLSSLLNNIPM